VQSAQCEFLLSGKPSGNRWAVFLRLLKAFFGEKIGHCLPFCLLFGILPKNGQNQNLQKSLENTHK